MTDETSVGAGLGDARSVLALAGGLSPIRDDLCGALLARGPPGEVHALGVTYNRSPRGWLDHVEASLGGEPASSRVIAAGGDAAAPAVSVEAPEDLTGIEIAVTDRLPPETGTAAVCFDSLTALLQYVDLDRAYRFVHALVERLWEVGAYAHFHLDPGAHDDETVGSLAALFDGVVAADPETLPGAVDDTAAVDGRPVAIARRPRFDPEGNA